jgi:hypothetical protein
MKRIFVVLFLSLTLLGCSTRYHSGEYFATGYVDESAPGKLKRISFAANEYTSKEKVEIFTLFRSAQLGKKLKKPYFSLYPTLTDAALDKKSTHPSFRSIFNRYRGYAYVLYKTNQEPGDLSVEEIYAKYEFAVLGTGDEGAN